MKLKTPLEGLCKTCIDPGYCCRAIVLPNLFPKDMHRNEVRKHIQEGTSPYKHDLATKDGQEPLPTFEPFRQATYHAEKDAEKPDSATWRYSCTALDPESGRCTIYENRPTLCREYKAGSDQLCIHYEGVWDSWIIPYGRPAKEK